jgi:hypothetical protein
MNDVERLLELAREGHKQNARYCAYKGADCEDCALLERVAAKIEEGERAETGVVLYIP